MLGLLMYCSNFNYKPHAESHQQQLGFIYGTSWLESHLLVVVVVVVVVVITPPLPRDGGTAPTAIQVHAVSLIDIRLGEDGSPFRTIYE